MHNIILFELNEVPFRVLDYYCDKYPQSTLSKVLSKSYQFETVTKDQGHLHPWSTWPTLHRGVTNAEHKIKDLGQGLSEVNKKFPSVWEILKNNGVRSGVCASLHTYPVPDNFQEYEFFIPDPFSPQPVAHPKYIVPFQKFNLEMARKSVRNVDTSIDKVAAMKLGMSFPKLGITVDTVRAIVGQLISERTSTWKSTRRRTYQSVLVFDVFYKLLKKKKPQFATFFSNHAASAMHRYWAATFPEDYKENKLSPDWINKYGGEIDFAMHKFDKFLSRLVSFVDSNPEYKLMVASSMGQAATTAEPLVSELAVTDFDKFLSSVGIMSSEYEVLPAMHPQYNLKIVPDSEIKFEAILKSVIIDDEPLKYRKKENGFFSLDFGRTNLSKEDVVIDNKVCIPIDIGLENQMIDEEASGTAYHIPEGFMFIYDPQNPQNNPVREKGVDTTRVTPSILKNFDVDQADYMNKELIEAFYN